MILAIDQGTTSTRALLLDQTGKRKIVKSIEHKQFYPKTGWVEHDPEELLNNIRLCIDCCENISAIGIDNQGESCLAWNAETKEAICPVIVWQDNRTQTLIDQLVANGAQQEVLTKTGLPLDSYFSASKLAWIVEHIPEAKSLLKKGKLRLGTTDAYFLDHLTDNFVTDITTASRTSLMNLETGEWDEALCTLFNVPIETLPKIVPTVGDFGSVKNSNGQLIPITASVVDQQAALYGQGCHNVGDAKITFGTGAFALVNTGETAFKSAEQGLLPTVAWQFENQKPIYALDGGVYSAGSAINWAKNNLGLFDTFEQINQFSKPSAIVRNLVFVPALTGLGCPHWDRRAGGLWIGLSLESDAMDLMQSILEGIAFRAAEVIEAMDEFAQIKETLSIDGGVSANPYFCQFLADVLNRKVFVKSFAEITALGTALLAGNMKESPSVETGSSQLYHPKQDRHAERETFKNAVDRSALWKPKEI